MSKAAITPVPAQWGDEELQGLQAEYPDMLSVYDSNASKYNPRPGAVSWLANHLIPL